MPRNERGQFTRNNIPIPLPSLSGLYKIFDNWDIDISLVRYSKK